MKTPVEYFYELSKIPRGSGNEKGVCDWLEAFAKDHGFEYYRDSENNILIKKPGIGRTVVLQGHSDMVCEKNEGVDHDFEKDPITIIEEFGHLIHADHTTLGADDGVSIAVMLSLLSDDSVTVPLECLVTSKEEIGLIGMSRFDLSKLEGRIMINLDSEDEGIATVSCSGGVRSDISLFFPAVETKKATYIMKVRGLYGGHSGEDIHKNRGNAITLTMTMLSGIEDAEVVKIDGGSKDNAIPRECTCVFTSDHDDADEEVLSIAGAIRRGLCEEDKDFSVTVERTEADFALEGATSAMLGLLLDLRLGVIEMNPDIPGLVKTSANLGVIRTVGDSIVFTILSRSSDDKVIDDLIEDIDSFAVSHGGCAAHSGRYPGWDFDKDSYVRDLYLNVYSDLFGRDAKYEGIHAGLECGIVKSAIPDMDIISIGPDIKSPHTPDETLNGASLDRLYLTVLEMLRQIAASLE